MAETRITCLEQGSQHVTTSLCSKCKCSGRSSNPHLTQVLCLKLPSHAYARLTNRVLELKLLLMLSSVSNSNSDSCFIGISCHRHLLPLLHIGSFSPLLDVLSKSRHQRLAIRRRRERKTFRAVTKALQSEEEGSAKGQIAIELPVVKELLPSSPLLLGPCRVELLRPQELLVLALQILAFMIVIFLVAGRVPEMILLNLEQNRVLADCKKALREVLVKDLQD
eukprot:3441028-Rhodomonas_salina.2